MPVANDDWMGLWVNGMTAAGVLLLMKQRVPCFIVHEFPPEMPVLRSVVPRPPTFFSFVEGTDVVYLIRNNTYQLLAESQGRLDSLFRAEDGQGEHEERGEVIFHVHDFSSAVGSSPSSANGPDDRRGMGIEEGLGSAYCISSTRG
jgi:hypothetical protein